MNRISGKFLSKNFIMVGLQKICTRGWRALQTTPKQRKFDERAKSCPSRREGQLFAPFQPRGGG
jgi:hypothetical protein